MKKTPELITNPNIASKLLVEKTQQKNFYQNHQEYIVQLADHNHVVWSTIFLDKKTISALWWDLQMAGQIFYNNYVAKFVAEELSYDTKHAKNIVLAVMLKNNMIDFSKYNFSDPVSHSAYLQFYLLSQFPSVGVMLDVQLLLQKTLKDGSKVRDVLDVFYQELFDIDIQWWYQATVNKKEAQTDLHSVFKKYYDIIEFLGIIDELEGIEEKRQKEIRAREAQMQQKYPEEEEGEIELESSQAPQFDPTYNPQDSLSQSNKSKKFQVIGSFYPAYIWYLKTHSMQQFNADLKRSIDTHKIKAINIANKSPEYVYNADMPSGMNHLPLPYGYTISNIPAGCTLYLNESWDYFLDARGWQTQIGLSKSENKTDHHDHSQELVDITWTMIKSFLNQHKDKTNLEKLHNIAEYIKNKYYDTWYQWTFLSTAWSAQGYIENLRSADRMECYSANTLFVILARSLWFQSKLSVGYRNKLIHNDKSYITKNDGHAWTEILIDDNWTIIDVTPTKELNPSEWEKEKEKETQEYSDPLDALSDEEIDKLRKQMIKNNLTDISDSARWLLDECELDDVIAFEKLKEETEKDSDYISSQLKKLFEKKEEEQYRKWIHTRKQTWIIDISKMMNENPGILCHDPQSYEKLANEEKKIYLQYIKEFEEKIDFPKEFQISIAIDLSGSMHEHPERIESVKKHFLTIMMALGKLSHKLQKFNSKITVNILWFGTDFKYFTDKPLRADLSNTTYKTIINSFREIETNDMGWNQDHLAYQDLYSKNNGHKNDDIIKLWILFTDGVPDDEKKVKRSLGMLERDCKLPFASILVGNEAEAIGYKWEIKDWPTVPQKFLEIVKEIYVSKIGKK